MDKEYYLEQYKNYNSEYLLKLKRLGSELEQTAHDAIEELLKEDGYSEKMPSINDEPEPMSTDKNIKQTLLTFLWLAIAIISLTISKLIASTELGLVTLIVYILYLIYSWLKKRKQKSDV